MEIGYLAGMTRRSVTLRLPKDVATRLDALAARAKKPIETIAEDAVLAYLDLDAWQVAEIEAGVREADAGDVLTDEELADAYRRWTS